jgi:hypothetical protein
MEESILKSTKRLVNVAEDDPSFDAELIAHINSAFSHLHLLGIGPEAGFRITGDTEQWETFFADNMQTFFREEVKSNIGHQVKLAFDPSMTPHLLTALQGLRDRSDFALQIWREENEWFEPEPGPLVIDGGDPTGT